MSKLIEQLKIHEGVREKVYLCSAGYETIGVGRNISESGLGLSNDEIDYLLSNDIKRCQQELEFNFDWFKELDEVRRDAMINLCFNIGVTSLKKFSKAIAAMNVHDYETASMEFLDSRWASQVGTRALDVTDMIRTGDYNE
jgi:lysozyme|tara:strand:- start:211 stop:633 length:423 start_codon:yes stop_codon:yes gene_type:complete